MGGEREREREAHTQYRRWWNGDCETAPAIQAWSDGFVQPQKQEESGGKTIQDENGDVRVGEEGGGGSVGV